MKLSDVDKTRIDEWIDKHRKMILLCASFEDAAFIISRDLFGFKTREDFVIKLIAAQLHGGTCSCNTFNQKTIGGLNAVIKYDTLADWKTL